MLQNSKALQVLENKPFQRLWLLPDTAQIVDQYLDVKENVRYKEIARKTKEFLASYYSDYSLELLATVDYIFRNDPELHGWFKKDDDTVVKLVKQGIENWSARKAQKFNEDFYIEKVVTHLREFYNSYGV